MFVASHNRSLDKSTPNSTSNDATPVKPKKRSHDWKDGSPKISPPAVVNQSPLPFGSSDKSVSNDGTIKAIVGVALALFCFIVLIVLYYVCLRKRIRKQKNHSIGYIPLEKGGTITYEELEYATEGFADHNLIGQGGFGHVHKGVLASGKEVAVKSLKEGSKQGEREFRTEIDIISRVYHRNLVSLVGYCIHGAQRMLVYEFVPNHTLDHHLHGKHKPKMDWHNRMKIAIGSAKGLAYLHEDCYPRIIHRDVKSSNVLIDDSFEAKVSDFGLSKLITDNETHVSTRVVGTFGYLAPEYAGSGQLTDKSDIFSFGVILLELISGKRPLDFTNATGKTFMEWARPLLNHGLENDGRFGELLDPILEGNYNSEEMQRMAVCAASCIHHYADKRPKMGQLVRALEGDLSLDDVRKEMMQSSEYIYDEIQYIIDRKKFENIIMSTQESDNNNEHSSKEMGCH